MILTLILSFQGNIKNLLKTRKRKNLEDQNNITRLYVNTQMLYFYIGSDGTYDIDFNQGYHNNTFAIKAYDVVYKELEKVQETIIDIILQSKLLVNWEMKSQNNIRPSINVVANRQPTPRARSPPFGCSLIPAKCN